MKIRRAKKQLTIEDARRLHRNRGVQKHPRRLKSPKRQLEDLEQLSNVLNLVARGFTYRHISRALGIEYNTVANTIARAMAEFRQGIAEDVARICTSVEARENAIIRAYMEEAVGGVRTDPETGEKIVVKRNAQAAQTVQRSDRILTRLAATLQAGQQTTVVTTGPVITTQIDEMEMSRLMRAQFSNEVFEPTPLLIEATGEEVPTSDDDAHAAE